MEMRGIEPRAFHMQSERSTTELHPLSSGAPPNQHLQDKKPQTNINLKLLRKKVCTHGGTRTPNLRFRRPTPYPLGHAGTPVGVWSNSEIHLSCGGCPKKIALRRPGIEPGSQEWESCMIPLHQRRYHTFVPGPTAVRASRRMLFYKHI